MAIIIQAQAQSASRLFGQVHYEDFEMSDTTKCPNCGQVLPFWVCKHCKRQMPMNFYKYEAHHKTDERIVKPLCAKCIRGDTAVDYCTPEWKHIGPLDAHTGIKV